MSRDESLNNQMEFDQLQAHPTSCSLPIPSCHRDPPPPPPNGPQPTEQELFDQGHLWVWKKQLNLSLIHLIINPRAKNERRSVKMPFRIICSLTLSHFVSTIIYISPFAFILGCYFNFYVPEIDFLIKTKIFLLYESHIKQSWKAIKL